MTDPREAIIYQFPVTVTLVLRGGPHEHYPTEVEAQTALTAALDGLSVRAKFSSYAADVLVGEAECLGRGMVPG